MESDLDERIDLLLENFDGNFTEPQRHEVHDLLIEAGYDPELEGTYIRRIEKGAEIVKDFNVYTRKEGITYMRVHNSVQLEDFMRVNAGEDLKLNDNQVSALIGTLTFPFAGTMYAAYDLPYAFPIAVGSFAAFFIGLRVLSGSFLWQGQKAAGKRFERFNPVIDAREALYAAFGRNPTDF